MPAEIVCHRGANHAAPENTLRAAEICFEEGYDYVELDLRTTGDGRLVVLHDATVDRTTNGSGPVAEASWDELAELDAGSWFGPRFADQRIPLFSEILSLAATRGGRLYVEPKAVDLKAMLAEVTAAGMLERCFFGSELTEMMSELRALAPTATLMSRRCDFPTLEATQRHTQAQIVEFDRTLDDLAELPACKALGARSMIYDQTHEIAGLKALAELGPDLVNLDRPDLFKQIRDGQA